MNGSVVAKTPDVLDIEELWAVPSILLVGKLVALERAIPFATPVGPSGLRPVSRPAALSSSPLLAYRWVDTDAALADQLALEDEGYPGTVECGHAAVRYTNPTNGKENPRRATRSPARRSGPTAIATCRGSPGTRPDGCGRASSDRTRGTS